MPNARIVSCVLLLCLSLLYMPAALAFDSEQVVLLALNPTNAASATDISELIKKLHSQFRFPKYEVLDGAFAPPEVPDRDALEKITAASGADDVIVLDIREFFTGVYGVYRAGVLEKTSVNLAINYYNKKTGQFGRIKGESSTTHPAGIDTGALSVSLEVLEEMLNKLDPVFPRQFPGPRY